jgi:hypothetical protein
VRELYGLRQMKFGTKRSSIIFNINKTINLYELKRESFTDCAKKVTDEKQREI